jgi:uncharacterized protein (DUF433 family)
MESEIMSFSTTERFTSLIERLPDCLHWSPDGEIRVVGRRISLFNILKSFEELGESPETIAESYELPLGLVREVIAFTNDHRPEVDPYMADYRAELDCQLAAYKPSPAQLRIHGLMEEQEAQQARRDS